MSDRPILYSFRRCPYAMRARMALWIGGASCELREVRLAHKPVELIEASAKATVPVLLLAAGKAIDESIEIMRWALSRHDPETWLAGDDAELLATIDGPFKHHLDRYKYSVRYQSDSQLHRAAALAILHGLNKRLSDSAFLCGPSRRLADIASFPFIRQFANHDREWFDSQNLPHLRVWLDGLLGSELFAAVMARYPPWKPGDVPVVFGQDK